MGPGVKYGVRFSNSIDDLKSLTAQLNIVFPTVPDARLKSLLKSAVEKSRQRAAFSMSRRDSSIYIFRRTFMNKKRAEIENRKQRIRNTVETLFRQLLISGVAHGILEPLKAKITHLAGKDGIDENGITAYLKDELAAMIRTDTPFLFQKGDGNEKPAGGRPEIAVMVGTTGVGKTTTLAKIAAQVTLKSKLKTVFLTIDTYRIAATQQLGVLGDIIGIPTEVVYKESDLLPTIEHHPRAQVILVDTAGRSQRNNLELLDIQKYLSPLEKFDPVIFLVISANLNIETMRDILKRFGRISVNRLIFTKADETVTLGAAFTIAAESGLPVAYICTGQNIPDDITIPTPEFIVNRLMSHNEPDLCALPQIPIHKPFLKTVQAPPPNASGVDIPEKTETDAGRYAACENQKNGCADKAYIPAGKINQTHNEDCMPDKKTVGDSEKTICDIPSVKTKRIDPSSLLDTDTIEIEIGAGLVAMGGAIAESVSKIRNQIVLQTGFITPPVRIRDHVGGLGCGEYAIKFKGREISRQLVKPECVMLMGASEGCGIAGAAFTEPAFGAAALWINREHAESARNMGYSVFDIPLVIATHLKELVIKTAHDLMGIRECRKMAEAMRRSNPELAEAVLDGANGIGERGLLTMLKSLLKDRASIRSAITIFECVFECLPEHSGDIPHITRLVKTALTDNETENNKKPVTAGS